MRKVWEKGIQIMKPSRNQKVYLQKYFKLTFGYGNKCIKCRNMGSILNITNNLIEFHCEICGKTWAFESKETVENMLLKGMGVKDAWQ